MQVFADNWLISVNTTGTHTSIVFFQCIILECGININNRLGPRRKRKLYTQSSHLEIYTHVYRFVRTAPDSPAQLHDTMHRTPKQRISPPTARTAYARSFSTHREFHTPTGRTKTNNTPRRHRRGTHRRAPTPRNPSDLERDKSNMKRCYDPVPRLRVSNKYCNYQDCNARGRHQYSNERISEGVKARRWSNTPILCEPMEVEI